VYQHAVFEVVGGLDGPLIARHGLRDDFEVSTPELHDVVRLEDRYGREDRK